MIRSTKQNCTALLLVSPLFFASNMVAARWSQKAMVPPVFLAFARWTLALLLLLPFVAKPLWQARKIIRKNVWNILLVGGTGMGLVNASQYIGARSTTASNIGLIVAIAPIIVIMLEAILRKETPSPTKLTGMTIAMLGILVLLGRGDPRAVLNLTFGVGDLWILLSAVGWAIYTVLLKRMPLPKVDDVSRIALLMFGGMIVLAPCCLIEAAAGRVPHFNFATIGSISFLALVPGICGYLAYLRLVAQAGETTASISGYLIPFYTAILAWPLLGEMPHAFHLLGIALILPGVALTKMSPPQVALRNVGPMVNLAQAQA